MTDDDIRDFTAALFGREAQPDPVPDPPDPARGNHVPKEGNNPRSTPDDIATFTAALFERAL